MPSEVSPLLSAAPAGAFININGVRLHYLDWGGQGAPILILHATGLLGRVYAPFARALSTIGHVYSYDQRGHGDSERSPDLIYDWNRTADDLEAFILAMGWHGIRAFGHSAGGTAIGTVLSRRPDLIARAVLVEPVLIDPDDPSPRTNTLYERTLKRRAVFDDLPSIVTNYVGKPPFDSWRAGILNDYCIHGTRAGEDGKRYLKCLPEDEARVYESAVRFDGFGYIKRSSNPLYLLFGERTDTQGIVLAERLVAPQRQITIVPYAGHFLPMEEPDYAAQITLEFLKTI
jgi:pimeloyl-ACP methyl ester carboxylesterase